MKLGKEEFEKGSSPFYIAEIGDNHNGDIESAKKLILQAKQAGADAVKFQLWTLSSLYAKEFYKGKPDLMKTIIQSSVSFEEFRMLYAYAESEDVLCSASVFNEEQAKFLINDMKVPFIKVASMSLNQPRFLHEIGELVKDTEVPIIISTGMCELEEIINAVQILQLYTENIIIMYCVSLYPPEMNESNFYNIDKLKNVFPHCIIGYSDHYKGISAIVMAVSRGINIVEKHFDFQYGGYDGFDAHISIGGIEFMKMKEICDDVFEFIKNIRYESAIHLNEVKNRKKMRTSIYVTRDIKKGEVFKSSDFAFKRPGKYLEPKYIDEIIDRIAWRDFEIDTSIVRSDYLKYEGEPK